MMKVRIWGKRAALVVSLTGLFCPLSALAECTEPAALEIPNGATAKKKEMLAAYRDMRTYQQKAQAYLDCLDALKLAEPDVDVEVLLERLNAYNRTVEKMDNTSREVHRQLDIFNAR